MDNIAKQLMMPGTIAVIPTDTVYGLAARATDEQAVTRLYALKSREHKPGTIIATSIDQLVNLGIKRRYLSAVKQFWPGSVSVVVPCPIEMEFLHQGVKSLALRVVDKQELIDLLAITGPLLTSSANYPGENPAVNVSQAKDFFGDKVDFYLDGGDLSDHKASTIIRVIDDSVEIIRQGAVEIKL